MLKQTTTTPQTTCKYCFPLGATTKGERLHSTSPLFLLKFPPSLCVPSHLVSDSAGWSGLYWITAYGECGVSIQKKPHELSRSCLSFTYICILTFFFFDNFLITRAGRPLPTQARRVLRSPTTSIQLMLKVIGTAFTLTACLLSLNVPRAFSSTPFPARMGNLAGRASSMGISTTPFAMISSSLRPPATLRMISATVSKITPMMMRPMKHVRCLRTHYLSIYLPCTATDFFILTPTHTIDT